MLNYVLRRCVQAVFILLIVLLFTFSLPYLQSGGLSAFCVQILGLRGTDPHLVHVCDVHHGFTLPYFVRFGDYIRQVAFHFDLGRSYKQNMTVNQAFAVYIPRTIWLALVSLFLAIIIAVPLGVVQAWFRNTLFDYAATGIVFVLYAAPAFLLGILMLDAFSFHTFRLPNSPPSGVAAWAMFTDPVSFILPVATLTLLSLAALSRFMRSSVLDVLVQEYTRTAKAKGCSSSRILFRHTMRNALGPIVTIIGLSIPGLLGGALIIEEVFNYPGMGFITVGAAQTLDTPIIMGAVIITTLLTVAGNLAADLGLVAINPRIRLQGSAR